MPVLMQSITGPQDMNVIEIPPRMIWANILFTLLISNQSLAALYYWDNQLGCKKFELNSTNEFLSAFKDQCGVIRDTKFEATFLCEINGSRRVHFFSKDIKYCELLPEQEKEFYKNVEKFKKNSKKFGRVK